MKDLDKFLEKNKLKLVKKFQDSILSTLLVVNENNTKYILKSNTKKENKVHIDNELDTYRKIDFERHNINVPKLIQFFEYPDTTIILIEYIEGTDLSTKLENNSLQDSDVKNLAKFIYNIENISYYETLLSIEKKNKSFDQINNNFYKYAKIWKEKIEIKLTESKIEKLEVFIYELFKTCLNFKIETNGFGERHGSSKLREFIDRENKLYVVDWHMATTHYIKYYEMAGIIGFILTRTSNLEFANNLIFERRNLEKNKNHFDKCFKFVLAQRLLGDIWDVTQNNLLEEKLNFVKNSWDKLGLG